MQIKKLIAAATILLAVLLLAGCAPEATPAPSAQLPRSAPVQAAPAPTAAPAATAAIITNTGSANASANPASSDHMIIKNGDIELLVKNTDVALDDVTQIVGDSQGYIVSSKMSYQDYYGTNYKYATLTIDVPVDQFKNALRRLRGLAIRVTNENETGQDVTDQYVDLQAQLQNLEATRDRIKGFLDQAKTVDDALKINQQLSDIEGQIEQIQGKINYLSTRSAFSTITITLDPDLPTIVATPTPTSTITPTPTLAPIQPLGSWDPGRTTQQAARALVVTYRVIIELLIWVFMVLVPILAPPILVIWLIVWLVRRRYRKPAAK
jgi:hypothetical protein